MRDLRVRRLGLGGALTRRLRRDLGLCGCALKLRHLRRQRSPARLELEQHRLGGFAREPELAPDRVVPEALGGDCRLGDGEQVAQRDDGQLGDALGRSATDEDGEAAESGIACPPQQLEAGGRIVGDERGRPPAERGGNRTLGARHDVEQ